MDTQRYMAARAVVRLGVALLVLAACRKETPVPAPLTSASPADVSNATPPPVAPTPETADEPARPTPGELLLVALANHATAEAAALLAPEVTLTTATDDACHQAGPCAEVLALVTHETLLQVDRVIQAGTTLVVQASVRVHGQAVGAVLLVETDKGLVTTVRHVGSTLPWRFLPRTPPAPLPEPTPPATDVVRGPADPAAQTRAAALAPVDLAEDPTAHGLVEPDVRWHDMATGKTTVGAEDNRQALRAFLQHFTVVQADVVRVLSAGTWLVVERTLTLELRAPVVPVPPTSEPLRVRMVDVVRLADGKVAEVWAYSDPFAFLPAVELPTIPTLH